MSTKLHETTLQMLRDRPKGLNMRQIADDTGLGYDWLRSLNSGRIPNPGVQKIEKLHDYLAAHQSRAA
jgi:hypothetical protein